ncbi:MULTISPECIES: hypothetical protein [Streptomyces]|uniref:Crystal protein ET79 n=1 Tax=Streptomyces luteosporeus TaxID=173856 RepID=A0ABP6GLW1_9ACTN
MRRPKTVKTAAVAALTVGLAALATVGSASAAPVTTYAARSTVINLENRTGCDLYRTNQSLDHGIWTVEVPQLVRDGEKLDWASESNGFMTGTEGRATFQTGNCGNPSLNYKEIELHWDNPYVGSNQYSERGNAFLFVREGGSGNNANVTWRIWGR